MKYEIDPVGSWEPVVTGSYADPETPSGALSYGPVVRELYCFECNVSGYGSITVNGNYFAVKPGDCYIVLPGDTVSYASDARDPRRGIWCFVSGRRVGELLRSTGITSDAPFLPEALGEAFYGCLCRIHELREEMGLGVELRRTALVYELLALLNKDTPIHSKSHWVDRAIAIFEAGYFERLTVADVARQLGFERTYFSVMFKEKTGVSPHAYLTAMRVRKARKLLAEHDYTVGEAAEAVGLDPRNFSRIFKRETGRHPKDYKT